MFRLTSTFDSLATVEEALRSAPGLGEASRPALDAVHGAMGALTYSSITAEPTGEAEKALEPWMNDDGVFSCGPQPTASTTAPTEMPAEYAELHSYGHNCVGHNYIGHNYIGTPSCSSATPGSWVV